MQILLLIQFITLQFTGSRRVTKLRNQTFLELFQHYIQTCILKDEVNRVVVELAYSVKRCSVVGVNKRQIFDVQ